MHDFLDGLSGCRAFGLRVALESQTGRAKLDLLGALRARLGDDDDAATSAREDADRRAGTTTTTSQAAPVAVDVRAVATFVDRVVEVEREAHGGPSLDGGLASLLTGSGYALKLEKLLHYNVSNIVLNLVADACSTCRVDLFGHSVRLALAPNDLLKDVSLDTLRAHRRRRCDNAAAAAAERRPARAPRRLRRRAARRADGPRTARARRERPPRARDDAGRGGRRGRGRRRRAVRRALAAARHEHQGHQRDAQPHHRKLGPPETAPPPWLQRRHRAHRRGRAVDTPSVSSFAGGASAVGVAMELTSS
mmetsp:Transcript_23778/g.94280  ORF Transcript_23778/g.94280 Transcript_23778/m.94280 type:complete len:307 (+) Transcript_23778:707-1627(+)